MRVRVAYTVEVGDDYREAIRSYYGETGMATREEIREWFRAHGRTMDDDLMWQAEKLNKQMHAVIKDYGSASHLDEEKRE